MIVSYLEIWGVEIPPLKDISSKFWKKRVSLCSVSPLELNWIKKYDLLWRGKTINRTGLAQKTAVHPGFVGVLPYLPQSSRNGHHRRVKARKSTYCNFNTKYCGCSFSTDIQDLVLRLVLTLVLKYKDWLTSVRSITEHHLYSLTCGQETLFFLSVSQQVVDVLWHPAISGDLTYATRAG